MPKILGLQFDIAWQDRAENLARVRRQIEQHAVEPGTLLVLPEMFDVGFTMKSTLACDDGTTHAFCADLARQLRCGVLGGFARAYRDGVANVATFFDESGREIARYEKSHPFSIAGEDRSYVAGDGPVVLEWAGMKIAPMICYDLRFPELFRIATKRGAEVFLVIANWPSDRIAHWTALSRARAIENLAYVVAVNRCGTDPKLRYPGQSQIIDPRGSLLSEAGGDDGFVHAQVDVEQVRTWRNDFPVLKDMKFIG